MDDLIKDHAARVRAVDPLIAGQDELHGKGEWLEVRDAVGLASTDRLDPDSLQATWSPLVVHRLQVRVAGSDPEAALGAVLDRWLARRRPDGPEQALSVSWPSRDTAPVKALALRGFMPVAAVAARRILPHTPAAPVPDVAVRRANQDDLNIVTGMYRRLIDYDAQFGWVTARASTTERLRESVAKEVLPLEWCWLAEVAGRVAGCVIVQPPTRTRWISSSVNAAPVAYLGTMYVEPAARGRGVGVALTDAAHDHAAAEGVTSMVLHHALPNPLSTPFWARRGYRPLFTQWIRHLP